MQKRDEIIYAQETAFYDNTGALSLQELLEIERAARRAAQDAPQIQFCIGDHVQLKTEELNGTGGTPLNGIVKQIISGALIVQTETGYTVTRLPNQCTRLYWVGKTVRYEHFSSEIRTGVIVRLGDDWCEVETNYGTNKAMIHELL